MRRLYRATHAGARCDLCAAPIASDGHAHLFDPHARRVACACTGCALIVPSSTRTSYRRVPDARATIAIDPAALLARLRVPVGVAALLVHDGGACAVAYPGPAGLVETQLDAWPVPGIELAPEVEAIVLSALPGGGAWRVGIDVVFALAGELRASWREPAVAVARVLG